MIGAEPVISTQSDTTGLWALDLLGKKYNWKLEHSGSMNHFITAFVNRCPTALLLDIKDKGTEYLERTRPEHVDVYYDFKDIPTEKYELIIAVTPWLYDTGIPFSIIILQCFIWESGAGSNAILPGFGLISAMIETLPDFTSVGWYSCNY